MSLSSNSKANPPVIFVLGGPGSGKGTQCQLLKTEFDLSQICVGDLLRREAASGTKLGRTVADIMQRGELVPGEVTMALLEEELSRLSGKCSGVLIDGFPRAMDQAIEFERLVTVCKFVLFFQCDDEVMIKRLLKRGVTSGRADDVEDVVKRRLATFATVTMPVVEYYRECGKLREIESNHSSIEDVYERSRKLFEEEMV